MPDVKYSFYRGDTSGIDATPLRDGQILFDQEAKKIFLDSKINGQLSRIEMKASSSGSYTPAGTVTVTEAADTKTSVKPFGTAGTLPTATWTVSGETATFAFNAGTLPTAGTALDVVTASGARTAAFSGTAATITVE